MKNTFCSQCGSSTEHKIPDGDNNKRDVCTNCGFIHYDNPKIVAGCIVYKGDKVLLCKRAIEPRFGLWTVPAGFMENGESTKEAAKRETIEEAGANIEPEQIYVIANLPHANQVYFLYLAELEDSSYSSGHESSEVRLFAKDEIPWDEIAFYTVKLALTKFFEDKEQENQFQLHEIYF